MKMSQQKLYNLGKGEQNLDHMLMAGVAKLTPWLPQCAARCEPCAATPDEQQGPAPPLLSFLGLQVRGAAVTSSLRFSHVSRLFVFCQECINTGSCFQIRAEILC